MFPRPGYDSESKWNLKPFFKPILKPKSLLNWVPAPLHGGPERVEHLEEDDAEAVDVALVVYDAVEQLLGSSVGLRPRLPDGKI